MYNARNPSICSTLLQVIYQTWQASGFLGRFWAPRDVVSSFAPPALFAIAQPLN